MRLILTLLFISNFIFAQTNSQKVLVSDLTRIKQIVSIVASPDGKKAVYGLRTIETNADNALEYDYRTHLYLIDLQAGSTPKALTRGTESASQATFSPDGKTIAFVRATKGKGQIFIMPLDGGEAWQLTNSKYGAGNRLFHLMVQKSCLVVVSLLMNY